MHTNSANLLQTGVRSSPLIERIQSALSDPKTWVILCALWAAIISIAHRHEMDPDGFGYLQMADNAAHGDFSALVNGHWSPGYPALLACLLALVHPSPMGAFELAHLLNFLIYLALLAAFLYFLRGFRALTGMSDAVAIPAAFVVFLKFSIDWIGTHNCTPDLAVATMVLFIAGLVTRRSSAILLGAAMALAYYVKAVMFPLSLALLAILLVIPHISRARLVLSLLAFAVLSAPLIIAQSRLAGHPTFGESGRLTYTLIVTGVTPLQRQDPGEFHYLHPVRRLTASPLTLEFATPFETAYPLWYAPAYWAQGMETRFTLRNQINALKTTLTTYAEMASEIAILIALVMVLGWRFGWPMLWMAAWPACAVALYALVHTEERFLGGFMILFFTGALITGLQHSRLAPKLAVVTILGIGLLIPTGLRLGLASARAASSFVHPQPTAEAAAAQALQNNGLRPGDKIAVIGSTFEPYYAWLSHTRAVVQAPDPDAVWHLQPEAFQHWLHTLAATGVKAIVAMDRPEWSSPVAWQDLPPQREFSSSIFGREGHRLSILMLHLQ